MCFTDHGAALLLDLASVSKVKIFWMRREQFAFPNDNTDEYSLHKKASFITLERLSRVLCATGSRELIHSSRDYTRLDNSGPEEP